MHSNRSAHMCVCCWQTLVWTGRWLQWVKRFGDGRTKAREVIVKLPENFDIWVCVISPGAAWKGWSSGFTEKKQRHQEEWPITSARFPLQRLTEGHVLRKLYHNHVNNHNSPVMFLSQLWNPISFSIRKGVCACVCVYKTYSR